MRHVSTILVLATLLVCSLELYAAVDVTAYGAKGDAQTNDTAAFAKALAAGKDVYVPPGQFLIDKLTLPEGTTLHGAGFTSKIIVAMNKDGVYAGNHCKIADLFLTGQEKSSSKGGSQSKALLNLKNVRDITIQNIHIADYLHTGIASEQAEDIKILNSRFEKLAWAVCLVFSKRVLVSGNSVTDAYAHAIQFWGNWKWESMGSEDLIFTNNYVKNGGGGPIWGTGARRVVMANNVIDGASDVGLDLEWCHDAAITGNTVRNAVNAGISVFYSSQNVSITGNSIVITDGKDGRRDGIWLTGTNTVEWKGDTGHDTVSITGNTIVGEGRTKHGINIGSGTNIICAGNVLQNADIYDRSGNAKIVGEGTIASAGKETLADIMTVIPLSQQWRFQIDPNDRGASDKWFAPDFKDSAWAVVRSDRPDAGGWEIQGFGGKDGKGYTGYAWYRAELPPLPEKMRTFAYLYFPTVDEQAWVYLSGELIGEHTEKSTGRTYGAIWDEAFSFDISKSILKPRRNVLAVRAHNAALNGGIRYPVYLILSDRPSSLPELVRAVNVLAKPKP